MLGRSRAEVCGRHRCLPEGDANARERQMRVRFLVALMVVFALMSAVWIPVATGAPAAGGLVTRLGNQLMLNGQPFVFTGVNIYNANSDGWCGAAYTDQQLDQAFADLGPGKEVVRAWFFQSLATDESRRQGA